MEIRSDWVALFVRRNTGRDEVDRAQVEALLRATRQRRVPMVDGIKGSTKKSDVHVFPITTPAGSVPPRVSLDSQNPEFCLRAKFTGRPRCTFRLIVEAVVVLKASAHLSATT